MTLKYFIVIFRDGESVIDAIDIKAHNETDAKDYAIKQLGIQVREVKKDEGV